MSNRNLALSKELGKAKLMVETLEAMIVMLYTSRPGKDGYTGTSRPGPYSQLSSATLNNSSVISMLLWSRGIRELVRLAANS